MMDAGHLQAAIEKGSEVTIAPAASNAAAHNMADVRARVSHDEGQTWRPEIYHLSQGHGYAAGVVLQDGAIVTVCGNTAVDARGEAAEPWQAQVVIWRLPDDA